MRRLILLLVVLSLKTGLCCSAVYYVDGKSGMDTAQGTIDVPFKTIQKASEIAEAGDTVYIQEGVYAEDFSPKNSGKEGKPIVFEGRGKVVFNGFVHPAGKLEPVPEVKDCYRIPVAELLRDVWYGTDTYLERKRSIEEVSRQAFSCWHDNGWTAQVYIAQGGERSIRLDENKPDPVIDDTNFIYYGVPDKEPRRLTHTEYHYDPVTRNVVFAFTLTKGARVDIAYRYKGTGFLYINVGDQSPDITQLKIVVYGFSIGLDKNSQVHDVRFLTLRNMELAYMYIQSTLKADHITLEDVQMHHVWDTPYLRGDNTVLRRVDIHHNRYGGIHLWGKDCVIDQSRFHHNIHFGVSFYAGVDNGVLKNSFVYENIGGPTGEGGVRISHGSKNVSILNNTIYRNSGPGIMVYSDPWDPPLKGTKIFNNIIAANDRNIDSPDSAGLALWVDEDSRKGFSSDYNIFGSSKNLFKWGNRRYRTLKEWQKGQGQDTHSKVVRTESVVSEEFLKNPPHEAIDSGIALRQITYDMENNKRPRGPRYDIGAIEKQ